MPSTDRSSFQRRVSFRRGSVIVAVLTAGLFVVLPGCDKADGKREGGETEIPALGSTFIPEVEVATVKGEDFVEHIDLPGVSVHGMESTRLHAKIGGFVKEIRRVGRVIVDGKIIQITDTWDRETDSERNQEIRVIDIPSDERDDDSTKERKIEMVASTAGDLEKKLNEKWKSESDPALKMRWGGMWTAYQKTEKSKNENSHSKKVNSKKVMIEMMEIDIGSYVEAGTLLAVLDIPEMADDLKKQHAVIERAIQTVAQKQAAIDSANAEVGKSGAEIKQAETSRDEELAKLNRDKKELTRIERLGGNVDRAFLEQVQFKVAASTAAKASAEQQIKSAEENVKVANASVAKAKADKNVANAFVVEARAELSRLKTLENYTSIRAPFSGTIVHREVDHGSFVRPAQGNSGAMPLFTITQTDRVRLIVPVPGRKSYKIEPGQTAVFHTIGGLPGVTIESTITRSSSTLNPASRMMRAEIYLTNPATNQRLIRDGRGWKPREGKTVTDKPIQVRPGMFGVVTVTRKWEKLRMIPATALGVDAGRNYVLEVIAGAAGKIKVVRRFVTVVFNDAKVIGISDGIPIGATIVATGVSALKDDQEITRKK